MKTVDPSAYPHQDAEGLCRFLTDIREQARADGHWKLASVTLPAHHIDPLAVLESIYDPAQPHFYLERDSEDFAVAGAEQAVALTTGGPGRFREVQAFADEVFAHTIAYGATGAAFGGPHVFCAFGFFDEEKTGELPSALAFVPVWQVGRREGRSVAVANARVDAETKIEGVAARMLAAHSKFARFDYTGPEARPETEQPVASEQGGSEWFQHAVESALMRIKEGRYEKIVLARAVDHEHGQPVHPLLRLNRLRERYPSCYAFSASPGQGASLVGATPERLVSLHRGCLRTEAIAGSTARGQTAREDARLGSALLTSEKDLREHAHVVRSIHKRLRAAGISTQAGEARPRLLRLRNVQHLWTPIQVQMQEQGPGLAEVVGSLHPTPAVGGTPRAPALEDIRELEPCARDWYAGALGWMDGRGEGEFVVGIRSALVTGTRVRYYAGAGIVAGSDPSAEHRETELKLRAMMEENEN